MFTKEPQICYHFDTSLCNLSDAVKVGTKNVLMRYCGVYINWKAVELNMFAL